MPNRFEKVFAQVDSSKQAALLYYRLIDTVERGSEDHKALYEAFKRAESAAMQSEFANRREMERQLSTEDTACICL